MDIPSDKDFELGVPALVCRWRLAGGGLPLANRHMRALSRRIVCGRRVAPELVAWAKQHIDLTLRSGSVAYPDGVLMLVVDQEGRAAMTVGPYVPLEYDRLNDLLRRAALSHREAEENGVPPETIWLAVDGDLVWGIDRDFDTPGASSLVEGLAHTMGIRVERRPQFYREVARDALRFDEAFLVSDEHGVVPASDHPGPLSARLVQGYERLLEKERRG